MGRSHLRKVPDKEMRWELEDLLVFVFPKDIQETYNKVAKAFMESLLFNASAGINGDQIGAWLLENNFSKATFYNRVLPRLIDIGLVERKRVHGDTGRKMILYPSLSFGLYLQKMGSVWNEIINTARAKSKNQEESKG